MTDTSATTSNDKFCIYAHINLINNKVYVGQTKQKPEYRWNHGKGYIKNEDFYNDIKLYGWDEGFNHIILETNLSLQNVDERERFWIDFYDSYHNGYNRNNGGHVPTGFSEKAIENFKQSRQKFWDSSEGAVLKEIFRKNNLEFWQSEEGMKWRKIWSERVSGEKNPNFGHKHSKETIQKMRECKLKDLNPNYNKTGIKNHLSIPVYCEELNKFFGSGQEAKRETGVDASSISKCCKHKQKTAGKMHWRYATEKEIIKLKEEKI